MSNKDFIALIVICAIVFIIGFVLGHRYHEMKTEGVTPFTYVQESQDFS
jgi:hypothetical protein